MSSASNELPPGPKIALFQTARYARDPYGFLCAMQREYGDLITVPTLNGTLVVIGDPAHVQQVFSADPETFAPFGARSIEPLVGPNSVLLLQGARHRRERKLLVPPFHGARMRASFAVPGLADIPFVGLALFRQHPMVYVAIGVAATLAWFLYRSRAGLVLRAVGESPESAHALGYPVRRIRLAAVCAGGALCGLAGSYLSVVYSPLWMEGMVAGKGWIALALTTFATWRPARVLLGAYLFGGVTMLQFYLQGQGVEVASQFLSMLPYVATIVVLVLISRNADFIRINMPASIGKPFHPGA